MSPGYLMIPKSRCGIELLDQKNITRKFTTTGSSFSTPLLTPHPPPPPRQLPTPPPPLTHTRALINGSSREKTKVKVRERAENEPAYHSRRCQQMLHGVTVAVMIAPLHTGTHRLRGLLRELPLHYPSWRQMPLDQKAGVVAKIVHLQKIYNGKNATLKERHWVPDKDGTYDMKSIKQARPSHISEMESSTTRERVVEATGSRLQHPLGVPYTDDEIMAIVRGGTFPVLVGFCWDRARSDDKFSQMLTQLESHPEYGGGSGSGGCRDDEPGDDEDGGEDGEDEDNS
ncbi:hypothetical protein Tco_1384875 [Tanacetum coccineum]